MDIEDVNMVGFFTLSVILFFGIPGNIISVVVWTRGENCSKSSSAVYFKLLAVCDLLVLLVPGVDYFMFLYPWNRMDLRLTNDFLCKFLTAAFLFSRDMSVGMTIALTIERALTVCFPFRSWQSDVRKRAYIIFVAILTVSFSLSVPYIVSEEIVDEKHSENETFTNSSKLNETNFRACTYASDSDYIKFMGLYNTIHFSCHVFIPIITLTVCNSVILRKLCKNKDQHIAADSQTIRKSIHTVTVLVICIGVTHIVSTLPMSLHVIYYYYAIGLTEFWAAFVALIMQNVVFLNSGINCVLYCFIGEEFRQDFIKLCTKCAVCYKCKDRKNGACV